MIKTSEGKLRRENPEITEAIESNLIKVRTALRRAEIMKLLKDHPGWLAIQDILKDKLAGIERDLDNFKSKEHREIDLLMQERRNVKFFLSIVDDFVDSIPGFEQSINRVESELESRRKQAAA